MNELHLFAGAGGGILGGQLLGHTCVCAVEIEPYCRKVLLQRQRDGMLPRFPIWDDVRTFDGKPWRGRVDIVAGGFPCQDISVAGKGAGIEGERSGMWVEMARIIDEVRPRFVFVENSPALTARGLGRVLGDLASMGFDARWGVLGAHHAGAPHKRDRIWILADSEQNGRDGELGHAGPKQMARKASGEEERGDQPSVSAPCGSADVPDPDSTQREGGGIPLGVQQEDPDAGDPCWWSAEPDVGRVAHGVASRVDRLKALGNGQVPAVAALAWRVLGGPVA